MRQLILLFWILALHLSAACCEAQQLVERAQVKRNQEAIYNSPELRYLKSLRQPTRNTNRPSNGNPGNPPDGNQGDGNNNGNNGDQQNGNNQNRGNNANDARNDRDNRQNAQPARNNRGNANPGRGTRSSSGSPSSGGGFGSGAAGFFQLLGYLAIAAMISVIVVLIVKTFLDREKTLESDLTAGDGMELGEIEPEKPPGLTPSEEFVRQAHILARRGEFREAIALLVLGAMSEVERRGMIRYRRGLTQRDYFRALRANRELADHYRQMVRIYEPLGFGRRMATDRHFQETLQNFEAGFRERESISQN